MPLALDYSSRVPAPFAVKPAPPRLKFLGVNEGIARPDVVLTLVVNEARYWR